MVELISSIAIVALCTAIIVVLSSDIHKVRHRLRYDKYMRKNSKCNHEYAGKLSADKVCKRCGVELK